MGRRVTVRLSSMCGTPYIHQYILIQLSSGEHWIPPEGPIKMPPESPKERKAADAEGGKNSPKLSVSRVANALQEAVSNAAESSGAQVSDVSSVTMTEGIYQEDEEGEEKKMGSAAVFEFSFTTEDDEIDFGITGIKVDNNGKPVRRGKTQLAMAVVVDEGEGELEVKPVEPKDVFAGATSTPSSREAPGTVVPKKKRKRVKSGEGGQFGDPRLFPVREGGANAAFWSPDHERAAFWEWDGLDVEDWAARMQLGTPSPELSEPALEVDVGASEREELPDLATTALGPVPRARAQDADNGSLRGGPRLDSD